MKISGLRIFLAIACTLALAGCNDEPLDTHPGQPVAQRRLLFKQFTRTLEPMGMVARERKAFNRPEFIASAKEMQELARQPWRYFTADSNYAPTHAKAEVWLKAAEFKQAQETLQNKANELAGLAQNGSVEDIRTAVNELQKSCKTCHNQFRNDS
jgi:cytochrome c556